LTLSSNGDSGTDRGRAWRQHPDGGRNVGHSGSVRQKISNPGFGPVMVYARQTASRTFNGDDNRVAAMQRDGWDLGGDFTPGRGSGDGMPPRYDWIGSLPINGAQTTGQLYRRHRVYDPLSGQFTQEDPIGLAGGVNLYGFAAGDPVNFSDPFGLCIPWPQCALAAGRVGAAAGTVIGAGAGTLVGGVGAVPGAAIGNRIGWLGGFGAATLGTLYAIFADDATPPLEVDETGKIHDLPGAVPDDWGEGELEESARALEESIRQRLREMNRKGGDRGHADRVKVERDFLREVDRRLREIQAP
jgi:RHS repeat-associated protein